MPNLFKKALTRTVRVSKTKDIKIPPSQRLLYAIYFSLGMTGILTGLEIVHLVVLGTWNAEIFTVIAGLVGNITGIFLTHKG